MHWYNNGKYHIELSRLRNRLFVHVEYDGKPMEGRWYGFKLLVDGTDVREKRVHSKKYLYLISRHSTGEPLDSLCTASTGRLSPSTFIICIVHAKNNFADTIVNYSFFCPAPMAQSLKFLRD